ncbi:DUF2997 domain-containing protein [Sporosarcina sp. FSL K6-1508]|uniref:DUF2997 domain-containing protein n=1 Tax=Sporosarcina sp. FSL K6-1508 TaxID=2921553 RepID=UPI0030F4B88F
MKRQIIIDIKKDGTITIEPLNYTGGACEQATAPFESVFGITEEKTFKPEFYETNRESNHLKNKS